MTNQILGELTSLESVLNRFKRLPAETVITSDYLSFVKKAKNGEFDMASDEEYDAMVCDAEQKLEVCHDGFVDIQKQAAELAAAVTAYLDKWGPKLR